MGECFKCHRNDDEVKLVNAILAGEIVDICEECNVRENIPVIRRPSSEQLRESENQYLKKESVKERLKRMAGIEKEDEISKKAKEVTDKKEEERKEEEESKIEKAMRKAKERNKPLKLVDNFNWKIYMTRRKKRMSRKELAKAISESETAIKMIENKQFPDDAERVIRKIGQYFNFKLIKDEKMSKEERIKFELKQKFKKDIGKDEGPAKVLKFDSEKMDNLTIADLQRMKEEKDRLKQENKQKISRVESDRDDMAKQKKADELVRGVKEKSKDKGLVGEEVELE